MKICGVKDLSRMIFDIYNPYVEGLDNYLKSCGDNDSFYLEYSQIS